MKKIAIVILNYLNYNDTIECVDSILMNEYNICGIVVIDNGSHNGSYEIIKKQYKDKELVHVFSTKKNLGFAKGNNAGIDYARKKLGADYILAVNNDTVFIDKEYINKMLNQVKPGIGILGSQILLKNKRIQKEYSIYTKFKDIFICYIISWSFYLKLDLLGITLDKKFLENSRKVNTLHGCALLFTPEFFYYYRGFYSKTFLYNEETILYFMLKKVDLKQRYVTDTMLLHKEDRSSKLSFNNLDHIKLKHNLKSYKYIFASMWLPYRSLN